LGVIFSIIGLRQIRKHPAQTGRGMALGGLGLSLLSLLLAVALVALVMLIGFENIMRGLRKSRFFGR
jgi:Tfp pilus assembly protein FimT